MLPFGLHEAIIGLENQFFCLFESGRFTQVLLYINKILVLVHRIKKLLVWSTTSVGSDISYFHKQTEYTLIRQLLQER